MIHWRKILDKYRKKLIIPLTLLLGLLAMLELYFVFYVTPQPNDECLWIEKKIDADSVAYVFEEVKFEGVTWNAGIRDGDFLIAINNEKLRSLGHASFLLTKMASGDSALYKIQRGEQFIETKVEVKKLVSFPGLAFALLGAIWLLVSFVALSAKPNGKTQILFFRIGACMVLFAAFNLLLFQNIVNPVLENKSLSIVADLIWSFGGAFLPFLIVHFFWVFPNEKKILSGKFTTKILYYSPLIIFLGSLLFRVLYIYPRFYTIETIFSYNIIINGNLILFFAGAIIGLISLFLSYLKLQSKAERNSIFVILIGFVIGLLAGVYTIVIASALSPATFFNAPEFFMPIILIAILPISFGYSIFKYSLMDVSDVVKNTMMYGAATITIAIVYFSVLYLLGQSLSSALDAEYQGVVAGVVFIFFAVFFQSSKDRFIAFVTRKFYPEQFAYQKIILKFINDIVAIVGLSKILESTSTTFVEALKLRKFGIMLYKPSENNMVMRISSGVRNDLRLAPDIAKIASHVEFSKEAKQPTAIEDFDFKKFFGEEADKLKAEKIFTIIPLYMQNKVIGLLLFGLKHSGLKFAGNDLEILSTAANQIAVAVENARLYEAEQQKLRMERDLENAREIQMSLLPREIPVINGADISGIMLPAMQVGGDYFDVIKISDDKAFVVVGDVSGKGLAASFYMSKLQTMIRLYCNSENSPKEILSKINREIYKSIEKNWFITIVLALFDMNKRTVTFCRAGHTSMLQTNSGATKQYIPAGIGVGLEEGPIFNNNLEEKTLPIKSGDIYSFYSDGVTEAMNEAEIMFGTDKFISLLNSVNNSSAKSIIDSVANALEKHSYPSPQHDDITMVVVKVK